MKITVDAKDYNLQNDRRLLIPYMEETSRYGIDLIKTGLLDKKRQCDYRSKRVITL